MVVDAERQSPLMGDEVGDDDLFGDEVQGKMDEGSISERMGWLYVRTKTKVRLK